MDLFDLPADQAAADDEHIARIIAEAIFPASFSPNPKVASPVAQPMSPEQNRARLALACMPAVKALREKGMIQKERPAWAGWEGPSDRSLQKRQ